MGNRSCNHALSLSRHYSIVYNIHNNTLYNIYRHFLFDGNRMQCVRTVQFEVTSKTDEYEQQKKTINSSRKKIENDLVSNWWHSIHLTICCLPHSFQRFISELARQPTAAAAAVAKNENSMENSVYMCEFCINFVFEVVFHNSIKTTFFRHFGLFCWFLCVCVCVTHIFSSFICSCSGSSRCMFFCVYVTLSLKLTIRKDLQI